MSNILELKQRIAAAESRLGFNPLEVEQGSFQWFKMRLGVITASKANLLLMKRGSATRRTYMAELAAEVATGSPAEQISAKAMEWGNENEPRARDEYTFITGKTVEQIPFIYRDMAMRTGCSPDGIDSDGTGLEIKCPFTTKVHIETMADGTIKKDYIAQMQFSMWVTGLSRWTFASYDPRMMRRNLHMMTVDRDDAAMKQFDDAVPQFILELDQLLHSIGFEFGEQWSGYQLAEQQAVAQPDPDGVF